MPVKKNCSFCGKEIEPGTGKMFIKKDGSILYFCSSKCEKNMLKLGRIPKYITWTNAYREEKKMRIHMVSGNDKQNADNIKA